MGKFANLYFKNHRDEANRLKQQNIPKSLFKYQPIRDYNIETLGSNELWFSKANALNDPFDCKATYYNINTLTDYLKDKVPSSVIKELGSIENFINDGIEHLRSSVRLTCFTESFTNMPMWAHYGDNHQGVCIEYDFSQLPVENDFSKHLYPVGYESNRYDITNLLRMLFTEDQLDPRINLLFFIMLMKHKSWAYEKEWRILFFNPSPNGGKEKCPIIPKSVYFGLNCSEENIEKIKKVLPNQTKCYKLEMKNQEYFHVNTVEI